MSCAIAAIAVTLCAALPSANARALVAGFGAAPHLATSYGPVRGSSEGGIAIFKGVYYAASTEGHRFQPSRAPQPWSEPVEALEYGDDCPQANIFDNVPIVKSLSNPRPQSEDCLVLNVWTPGLSDGGKRPIMVWLHGGGFDMGSASSPAYDGRRLAKRGDVVVVSVNHRLNAFGFLQLAGLSDDPKYADSGNAGIFDIVRALQWVRDNAAAIGGDPGNVTIFGESGGGMKVSTLMALPQAKGLFHRAIVQSAPLPGIEAKAAAGVATAIMTAASKRTVDELAEMPMADLLTATNRAGSGATGFQPVVDGRSFSSKPFASAAPQLSSNIPLLIGTTRDEWRLLGGMDPSTFTLTWDDLPARLNPFLAGADAAPVIAGMRKIFPASDASDIYFRVATYRYFRKDAVSQAGRKFKDRGAPVWMYRLDWESPVEGGKWKALHAVDVPFVMDTVAATSSMIGIGSEQQRLADFMSEAWIAFARTGNPQTKMLPKWPTFNTTRRATMIFNVTPRVADDPDSAERRLLEALPEASRP
jgi:para-nitrobenzyl esterase